MHKPHSEACDRNREPILHYLRQWLDAETVLEIGSGTGQHAVYFAEHLPNITWQPSDRAENIKGIEQWRIESGLKNIHPAKVFDVADDWPFGEVQTVFTSNTLHIMSWWHVEQLFKQLNDYLAPGGQFITYGPFNYGGTYTSESNAQFDAWLKSRDEKSSIREFEKLESLANLYHLKFLNDCEMPANNRLLRWQKLQIV